MNTHRMNTSRRWLFTTWLLLAVILTLAGPARAASFVVSNLNDSGKGSLRQAISDADASAGADTITFGVSGTILLSSTLPTITDLAGLTMDGTGRSITISGNDAVRIMIIYYRAALTVRNLTFADGNAGGGSGAGIVNGGGTLNVIDCTFSGNFTDNDGGAINTDGTLNVTGSTFSDNTGRGGGIYNHSGGSVPNSVTISNSIFSGNNGIAIYNFGTVTVGNSIFSDNNGGAIYNGIGTFTIIDSTLSGNRASFAAGAIYNYGDLTLTTSSLSGNSAGYTGGGIYNDGDLTLTNSSLSGNSAVNEGGGIFNSGRLSVTDSTFSGNTAAGGGGISNYASTLTVTNSTFSGNHATGGGAICNCGTVSDLTVTNSTFSGNTAIHNGGAINIASFGEHVVTGSTFSDNRAALGGAIYGSVILQNTIVANSTGGNCTEGAPIDGGGNLSWPDTTCPGLNADPLLGPLQDNGGPTQTLALLPGSPAIDAAVLANCPATDQRGVSRPQGAGCDIGAYESVIYTFSGFFQPVDNLPTWNVVQAGVGVPVRFSLGGNQGLNIFAAGYPVAQKIACTSGVPEDVIEETVIVGSSSLSYDAASDTYTYLWKTSKAWANTCRQLIIRLNDGTEHKANFKFVR